MPTLTRHHLTFIFIEETGSGGTMSSSTCGDPVTSSGHHTFSFLPFCPAVPNLSLTE